MVKLHLLKQTEEAQAPVILPVISHVIQQIEEADTSVMSPVISNSPPKS